MNVDIQGRVSQLQVSNANLIPTSDFQKGRTYKRLDSEIITVILTTEISELKVMYMFSANELLLNLCTIFRRQG